MARLDATQEFVSKVTRVSRRQGQLPEAGGEVVMRSLDKFSASLSALHSPQFSWRAGMLSTVLEEERLIVSLAKLYSFDDVSVGSFLRENSFLLPFLIETHGKIQEHFGPHVDVTLEVFTDPEAEDSQQLFALIHTGLPLEDEEDILENLYDEWWLDALPAARGKLVISVE